MVLVKPTTFTAGRDLVIDGTAVAKGVVLSDAQVKKFMHLDAAVDRGLITVSPDPFQRRKNPTHGPHGSAAMRKDLEGLTLPDVVPDGYPGQAQSIPAIKTWVAGEADFVAWMERVDAGGPSQTELVRARYAYDQELAGQNRASMLGWLENIPGVG